jgi:hypothetical protein
LKGNKSRVYQIAIAAISSVATALLATRHKLPPIKMLTSAISRVAPTYALALGIAVIIQIYLIFSEMD